MLSEKMLSQENEIGIEKEKGKEGIEQGRERGRKESSVEKKAVILPYTIQYNCNFIDIKGNIVRDRSYCETNKFNALLSSQEKKAEKEVEKKVEKGRRISALGTWDYSNPNILSIQLSNGMVRNVRLNCYFCCYCYCYCCCCCCCCCSCSCCSCCYCHYYCYYYYYCYCYLYSSYSSFFFLLLVIFIIIITHILIFSFCLFILHSFLFFLLRLYTLLNKNK